MVAILSLWLCSWFGSATGPGVMAAIKGDIGAAAAIGSVVVFSPQAHG
jgi:hypothetical protein